MSENTKYYKTRAEAESHREPGEKVWLEAVKGYYNTKPRKIDFWGFEREAPTHFFRYGRMWYTTIKEANENKEEGEKIYFDKDMNAYYNMKPKKSIWIF